MIFRVTQQIVHLSLNLPNHFWRFEFNYNPSIIISDQIMQLHHQSQLFSQQRHIHQLQQELVSLRHTNQQLQSQLHHVTLQRDNLAEIQQYDPIRMILTGLDPVQASASLHPSHEILEQRIHFHQQKILSLEQQLTEMTKILNHRDSQLLQINQQLYHLKQQQTSLINENKKLLLENQSLQKNKYDLTKAMDANNSKLQKFASQINQAKTNFSESAQKNSQEILEFQKTLDQLRNSWLRASNFLTNQEEHQKHQESSKIQQLNDKIKLQSQIMEEMGQVIDLRNDEIAQIHIKKNKNSESNSFDNYQHSIKNMIRSARQRQWHYTELLKKYQQMAQNYKQSMKQKQMLENQYAKLKESYENISAMQKENTNLKRQLKRTRQDLQNSFSSINQLLGQSEQTLKENDYYVMFMHEIYGSQVFMERINEEKQKYQQRSKQRSSKNLWANTRELIEMNQKLKQKLQAKK